MISFFVAALNEEENIEAALETITSATKQTGIDTYQVIAVNDGSTDRTGEILRGLLPKYPQMEIITHPTNLGMSASIQDALKLARYDRCLFVPGDNDLSKDLLSMMLKHWRTADMVLLFPINAEIRSYFRNILSLLYRFAYMVGFGVTVNYVNGNCIYTTSQLRGLTIQGRRFSIISEINTKLLRSGATYCEIPGYFQTGSRPRGTVSFKNLMAVCESYLRLLLEIHVSNRARYSKPAKRVFIKFN
jgi:glycosyltransferase involved in cell wall biosynthesis